MFESLRIAGLLSFPPKGLELDVRPLNVLIGPNGAGKSNLIDVIELLANAPRKLLEALRAGGNLSDWLWKGGPSDFEESEREGPPEATIEAIFVNPRSRTQMPMRYRLRFGRDEDGRFRIFEERLENKHAYSGRLEPYRFYTFDGRHAVLNVRGFAEESGAVGERGEERRGSPRKLRLEDIDPTQSILAQRRDPDHYPELTFIAGQLERVRIYREWHFGRMTPQRLEHKADLPGDRLLPDGSNLAHVLSNLRSSPVRAKVLDRVRQLYPGLDDFEVRLVSGSVQLVLIERGRAIPASRLSDGTLRFLSLVAILCHPDPGSLLCIEEPELGLHPDLIGELGEMLVEASTRTQLIITTHSEALVDALGEDPERILVVEREDGGTSIRRLDAQALSEWLDRYSLGELWSRGDIGGNRW